MVLLAALPAAPAAAQAPAGGDARAQAQAHLSRGNDLFTSDKFDDALAEFQAAFAAFPSPKLHFNIGQCQRALGHLSEALAEFRRFLDEARDVPPDLRREAERYISELKAAEDSPLPATATTTTAPLPVPAVSLAAPAPPPLIPPASTPAEPDAPRPIYKRWWFWTAVGVAAAGAAVGVVLLTRPRDPPCTSNCFR